jgi:hypothetical protein
MKIMKIFLKINSNKTGHIAEHFTKKPDILPQKDAQNFCWKFQKF